MIIYLYIILAIIIIIQLFGIIISRKGAIDTEKIIERDIGINCSSVPVKCNPEDKEFCKNNCNSLVEYECQKREKIGGTNSISDLAFNKAFSNAFPSTDDYYCLPKRSNSFKCEERNGGIPVWSGSGLTNSEGWQCLCMFPEYFGGEGCEITPGVCSIDNISFMNYDYLNLNRAPIPSDCKLNNDVIPDMDKKYGILVRNSDGTPMITPSKLSEGDSSTGDDNRYYRGYKSL